MLLFVAICLMYEPGRWIYAWAAVYLLWHVSQEVVVYLYRRADPADDDLAPWRLAANIGLGLCGLIWGVGYYNFIDAGEPLMIGLLMCAMSGLVAGSIGFCTTILPGFYAYNGLITGLMALGLFRVTGVAFDLAGTSALVYGLVIIGYGRAQHALIVESLRIRFSNDELVVALRRETLAAEVARREAEQASLAKSQFLAAASHDLRQPLYALSLFSGSLAGLRLDEGARAIVGDIQDSIGAMEALFAGLLDISKLEAGVIEPHVGAVGIDQLFDRLSQYFRPIALERGLDLRFRSDGEWVMSDAILLEQVLGNLLSNALRWTLRGGVLAAARRRGASIDLEIWDTGIGISPADRERVFDDFVQLGNSERDRRKGLGLGLAIARRSAALLGSRIALASKPGLGSRFSLSQPAMERPSTLLERGALAARSVPTVARDLTLPVLIVEDDADVRAALQSVLGCWNVDCDLAINAGEALAAVDGGRRYGLLISDYRLGTVQTGLDLIELIRMRHPTPAPPAILITGDFGKEIAAAAYAKAIPLLHKPVRVPDLARLLGVPH